MILVQEETCRALEQCTDGCRTAKGYGKGQGAGSWGVATKQCRESRQLQHHDDNRKLQIDVHARMRVAGRFRAAQVQGEDVAESAQAKV